MKFNDVFYQTDETLERDGVWIPITDDVELLIARLNNPVHIAAMDRQREPWRLIILQGGTIPEETVREMNIAALAEGVLRGWRGKFEDDDGTVMEYSIEKAIELMTRSRPFRELIVDLATQDERYKVKTEEEIQGNS